MNQPRVTLAAGMEVTPSVRLVSPLGAGGMGAVWLADHTALNTRVVVKFMLLGLDSSASARARFKHEAEAASQVKSPHVVQTFDYGLTADGTPFIVMEYLEGRDLAQEIAAKGALDPAIVVSIVAQVSKALTKAHAANVLHRDIKPDNIFLCHHEAEDELFVKLLDFGVAKAQAGEGAEITLDGHTKTGQVVGTPFYMSPEQVTAQKAIDLRSDLWSLGVVAFEALTGGRPYDGPSFGALAVKIATGEPPKPSDHNPSLPPSVDEWFARACARDPAKRFGSARELSDRFRASFEGVVSLPPVNSDSGARSATSGSRPRADAPAAAATPTPSHPTGPISVDDDAHARPSFVLASTVEGAISTSGDHSSLARSEPGGAAVAISDSEAAKLPRRGPPRKVIGVLLAIVIGAVIVGIAIGWKGKERSGTGATSTSSGTTATLTGTATDTIPPSLKATSSPTAPPDTSTPSVPSGVPLAEDAGAHAVGHIPPVASTKAHVGVGGHPRPPTSVKPADTASAPPARPPPPPPQPDAGRHNDPLF